MDYQLGIIIAILSHFGAVVWWGSQLSSKLGHVVQTLERHARHMESLQRVQSEMGVRLAVQEALRKRDETHYPPAPTVD